MPLPAWAYLWNPAVESPTGATMERVPRSTQTFSQNQARDLFFVPDWYPQDHLPMPDIIRHGKKPDVRACSSCHRAEGTGGPESASIAGLPVSYFIQQIADFKSGARRSHGPARSSVSIMTASAKGATDEEVKAAAEYYAALKPRRNIKVVEADMIPKVFVARLFYARHPDGGTEGLGKRIVETPDDHHQFELRDSRMQFTAYVPPGSIAKGESLAKTGGNATTMQCATCHGADLKGLGPIPRLAGRSPTYVVRQLYDFKNGSRTGTSSALMKPVVENLSEDDMIALAAYIASLAP